MNVKSKVSLEDLTSFSKEEQIRKIVDAVLKSHDIKDKDLFLNPPQINEEFFKLVSKLFGKELEKSVGLVKKELGKEEPTSIVIHGDYDVDGVSATAILWETLYFDLAYKNAQPFIPHRVNNGYGLSESSINDILLQLKEKGLRPGILITVDCGVASKGAVEYAKEKGFKVIVTDHHTLPEDEKDLPKADAVLHTYKLCGAGISWVLSTALAMNFVIARNEDDIGESILSSSPIIAEADDKQSTPSVIARNEVTKQSILKGVDLVALATLADIQELTGFNRALVIEGLKQLTRTNRIGLQALYDVAGIFGKPIGVYEVGWVIGPRLNATGRLEHALDALRLLVVKNRDKAYEFARRLNSLNFKRQQITKKAVEQAMEIVNATWNRDSAVVVASPEWHEGVIGLIAGKLVQKFNAPAIAISIGDELAKGSARSIEGINIVELLRTQEELFMNVGGHAGAAGFSIQSDMVSELKERLGRVSLKEFGEEVSDEILVDLELGLEFMSWELYETLSKLEPFGMGNPRPLFFGENVRVLEKKTVGKNGDHLALTFENGIRGIGFGLGEKVSEIKDVANIVYTLDKDDFRGGNSIQLKIKNLST